MQGAHTASSLVGLMEEQSSPIDKSSPAEPPAEGAQPAPRAEHRHSSQKTAFFAHHTPITPKSILWVLFFLVLTAAARVANYPSVIVQAPGEPRQIFFEDGDCYSRMTRVREVLAHWGVVHYHAFENFPQGIVPHTTAPMDYFIVLLALLLKPFMTDYVDMAGAIVAPVLGVMTTAFLALWARELNQQYRRSMLLIVSLSPILVHATALGRPDHHPLQVFLIAVGIGAELIMARAPCISWGIVSGAAWGIALWVSLYEPLVLFLVIYLTKLIFYRPKLFVKERLRGFGVLLAILCVAYFLEGKFIVRNVAGDLNTLFGNTPAADGNQMRVYMGNWLSTIGEMASIRTAWVNPAGENIFSMMLFRWVGWGLLVAPLLLIARLRDTKRTLLLLALLVTTFIFTLSELRWGIFFALVYAISLPWQLSLFKRRWLVWTLFLLSLWPVAREWDIVLFSRITRHYARRS